MGPRIRTGVRPRPRPVRRLAIAVVAASLAALGSVTPVRAASAGASGATGAGPGTYLAPIREDLATYANGAFRGGHYVGQPTDANGCVGSNPASNPTGAPSGNPQAYNCLPAGAAMALLPDGRLLYWNNLEGTEAIAAGGPTSSLVFDGGRLTVNDESRLLTFGPRGPTWTKPQPVDGGAHNTSTAEDLPLPAPLAATHYTYNDGDLFCADQVALADGSILTVGGTDWYAEPTIPGTNKGLSELQGIRGTRIFSLEAGGWVHAADMNYARWYPSLVTLGSGQIFVASGVTKLVKPLYPTHLADSGTNVHQTETYDPTTNRWSYNGAAADHGLPLFPRLHLLPDGHVYYDAAGQAFNPAGQAYDEALWNVAAAYDPATKTWHDLGVPGIGTPFPGFRGSTFSAALALRPDPTSHAYRRASFLTAGGVLGPSPGSYVAVADSRITTVDTANSDDLSTTSTGPLGRARWYSTAVPLPDGTVYAVSGADIDEVVTPGLESPIRTAELFTPTVDRQGRYTGGSWRGAGSQARSRTYHNDAVLLPDGSVLIGGHAPVPTLYYQVIDGHDLPGRPGTNNHHDASFQVWQPPYFKQTRPTIASISQLGSALTVTLGPDTSGGPPDPASIADVVLIRNTAQTHLVDGDNRTVVLPVIGRDAGSVVVQLPTSANVAPAGPYLLFANQHTANPADDAPGHVIPSIGRQVLVSLAPAPVVVLRGAATSAPAVPMGGQIRTHAAAPPAAAGPGASAPAPNPTTIPSSAPRPVPVWPRLRKAMRWSWLVLAVVVALALSGVARGRAARPHQVSTSGRRLP